MAFSNKANNDSDLLELVEQYRRTVAQQAEQIKQLQAEIEELKKLLGEKADSKAAKKPKFTEN